jgi:hypothetical protein
MLLCFRITDFGDTIHRKEVPIAVIMKSIFSWDVMQFITVEVHRRFGGTLYLHLQG